MPTLGLVCSLASRWSFLDRFHLKGVSTPMTAELIPVLNGRATLSDAVINVAQAMNPLGAAADIVATIGACVMEIRRFKSQADALRVRHAVASDIIRTRQG